MRLRLANKKTISYSPCLPEKSLSGAVLKMMFNNRTLSRQYTECLNNLYLSGQIFQMREPVKILLAMVVEA